MAIELVFETHSTTIDNEQGRATGWLPGQLSGQGRLQAMQLGRRRSSDQLTAVFSSDLAARRHPQPRAGSQVSDLASSRWSRRGSAKLSAALTIIELDFEIPE